MKNRERQSSNVARQFVNSLQKYADFRQKESIERTKLIPKMPLVKSSYSTYSSAFAGHLQTILPALLRKPVFTFQRTRISTPDNDFLDLDYKFQSSDQLIILTHGLEGDSTSPYLVGMASHLYKQGFDILAWNFRGCGGEINNHPYYYHSGKSDDLHILIEHINHNYRYKNIYLVSFSIGGNITLKYLGEQGNNVPSNITKACCFSVPFHLESAARQLEKSFNKVYLNRFIKSLKNKIRAKAERYNSIDISALDSVKNFYDFDQRYTAPINGFKDAYDYWTRSSSLHYLKSINIPTLVVNARNDPFLSPLCYPEDIAKEHSYLYLEIPEGGGHCGFFHYDYNAESKFWSEKRVVEFISDNTYL